VSASGLSRQLFGWVELYLSTKAVPGEWGQEVNDLRPITSLHISYSISNTSCSS